MFITHNNSSLQSEISISERFELVLIANTFNVDYDLVLIRLVFEHFIYIIIGKRLEFLVRDRNYQTLQIFEFVYRHEIHTVETFRIRRVCDRYS